MIAIVDNRIPKEAKDRLSKSFILYELESSTIVYPAISGHPDIFLFQSNNNLIVAPNSPRSLRLFLDENHIQYEIGYRKLGQLYPQSASYNAFSSNSFLIHNKTVTDRCILELEKEKNFIQVKQAYAACSTFELDSDVLLTSDKGIFKALINNNLEAYYFSPKGILLHGFKYGFIGGCVGTLRNRIYFIGSLSFFPEGKKLKELLEKRHYEIIELYQGPLFDGGKIIFIEE